MKKTIFLLIVVVFISVKLEARKSPIKFGKINKSDLEMTACSIDSSAAAVVLCDYGYFNGTTFTFTRILRIKILKKEGYGWADNVFGTGNKANIKGITYNLVDGEIVETKLKKSQIFTEHVYSNYYRQRVSMPNVEVGSVIDIQYSFVGFPRNWYFQKTIPVLRSELVLERTTNVSFRKRFFGYIPLSNTSSDCWAAINVPAFKREPYMGSTENYITKFEFDIESISSSIGYKNVTSDWKGVSNILLNHYSFGEQLKAPNLFLKAMAVNIKRKNLSDEDQIKVAIDTLHAIKWDGGVDVLTNIRELKYQYSKKVGNSADINIGLVVLLRKLGFETYPVVLSTRDNGILSPTSPSYNKLNYVVACTKLDGEFILLDATEELLPYYLLPPRCLNERGRLIDKDTSDWVLINNKYKNKTVVSYNLNLNNDLTLSGTLDNAYYDYAAYNIRKKMEEYADEDEYIDSKVTQGMIINDVVIQNVDSVYLPVKERFDISVENVISRIDTLVYMPLMPFDKIESNLFNSEDRIYPVDFIYPRERSGVVNITLPLNVEVVELPKPLMISMPDKSIDYVYSITQLGNSLVLNYRLRIKKPQIYISEYENLRMMYEYIIEKEAQPVILKLK